MLPPKWALGYMQSHRTLEDETQTARNHRHVPIEEDSGRRRHLSRHRLRAARLEHAATVVRLQPRRLQARSRMRCWRTCTRATSRSSCTWCPGIATGCRHSTARFRRSQARRWTRRTSSATGSSTSDSCSAGVDAFWPDEGDWFNLFERIKRHQLYYQGQLSTTAERAAVEPPAQRISRESRSGAAGCGPATQSPRGRRSRRRSPSASTTR